MSDSQPASTCDYCGLPVPAPLWGRTTISSGPQYCCVGCRFAQAVVQEKGDVGANRATMTRLGLAIFFTMNVMVFTFALWAYDLNEPLDETSMASSFAALLRSICLLVSLPVLLLLGGPLAQNAWQQLKRRSPSADGLILVGVVAAYGYSVASVWRGSGSLYVETGCVTLVFLTLGRWLEATGKLRSTESLKQLEDLLPPTVTRVGSPGSESIPLSGVRCGDTLRVSAGQRIPADGRLCSATASLDQQLVSGESWPVEAFAGDPLIGGTLNLVGDILLEVTVPPGEGTLARLVAAVREARRKQGPFERLADRTTRLFFPIVLLFAGVALVAHWRLSGFASGLLSMLSVLLIACPCALGIATPLAVWVALGTAARRGIVIGSGETLERLATAKAIRFDKTGTLTMGRPVVSALLASGGVEAAELHARALALSQSSTHVFSQAIARFCKASLTGPERDPQMLVSTVGGRGVFACLPGEPLPTVLGSLPLMSDLDLALPDDLESMRAQAMSAGLPMVLAGWGGRVNGVFILREHLRPEVPGVIADCRLLGLDVGVLTGDHAGRGAQLRRELAVPVQADLDPQQKIEEIRRARQRYGPVVMVGDGLNDAGACSTADVGIALGCGADVTRDSAGVCLVSNELQQIPWLLRHARRTVATVRSNLFWSFAYNSAGITLATLGWLHPSVAAGLMVGSSLYVIRNSLRLEAETERAESTAKNVGVSGNAAFETRSPKSGMPASGMPASGEPSLIGAGSERQTISSEHGWVA